MKQDNHFYGQNRVLADYVGIESAPPPIWGYLQHGWHPGRGFPDRYQLVSWLPALVWSFRNRRTAVHGGLRRVIPIGAAFLYLETMWPADPKAGAEAKTLVYPFHSAPGEVAVGSHAEFLRDVREREHNPLTVCLYFLDAQEPEIRRVYEATDIELICHGDRLDPAFLRRQMAALRSHERVVTNRVSTALFYAAALGKEVEVYGPAFGVNRHEEGWEFGAFQRAEWPELFDGNGLRGADARLLGLEELGGRFVRAPQELVEILGWSPVRAQMRRLVVPVVGARAAMKALATPPPAGPPSIDSEFSTSRHDPHRRVAVIDLGASLPPRSGRAAPTLDLLPVSTKTEWPGLAEVARVAVHPKQLLGAIRRGGQAGPRCARGQLWIGALKGVFESRRLAGLDWIHTTSSAQAVGMAASIAYLRDQPFSVEVQAPTRRGSSEVESPLALFVIDSTITESAGRAALARKMSATGW